MELEHHFYRPIQMSDHFVSQVRIDVFEKNTVHHHRSPPSDQAIVLIRLLVFPAVSQRPVVCRLLFDGSQPLFTRLIKMNLRHMERQDKGGPSWLSLAYLHLSALPQLRLLPFLLPPTSISLVLSSLNPNLGYRRTT